MSLPVSRRAGLAVATALLAAAALTACGGATHAATKAAAASPAPPAEAAVATSAVTIDNFSFAPTAVTVKAGTTVTWTNKDEEPHSVVSSEEPMHSPTLAGSANSFTHTFAKPGTYHYNCGIHPFMHGTVEVTA
jgi:plastocyanin